MKGFNHVSLAGNVTKDPEVRYVKDNLCIVSFTLAINSRTGKGENAKEVCYFPRCKAFGKVAEIIEKYVHKGDPLLIHGSIQTGTYDDKDGKKVYTTDVVVGDLTLLGNKGDNNSGGGNSYGNSAPAGNEPVNFREEVMEVGDDEDIPF